MNFARRLAKLEQTIVPGRARCRVCGYLIHPGEDRQGALIIFADGSWWDTTPRCVCGHRLMACGTPYPSDDSSPGGLNIINVSHYSLCVGGNGLPDPRFPLRPPRRLPPDWWGERGEPTRPGPGHKLCPIDAKMVEMVLATERAAGALACD